MRMASIFSSNAQQESKQAYFPNYNYSFNVPSSLSLTVLPVSMMPLYVELNIKVDKGRPVSLEGQLKLII